jgi:hypothetical protein
VSNVPEEGWAVRRADGETVALIHEGVSEIEAWIVALGFPDTAAIEAEKRGGARAFKCRLVEVLQPKEQRVVEVIARGRA